VAETSGAFASFEQKWLAAHPEYAAASVFLPPERRHAANAFGCLVHELDEAAVHVHDVQVASAKLGWWRGELISAAQGRASHPITLELFRAPPPEATRHLWPELADASLARLSAPPAATLADLLGQHADFHRSVVRADASLSARTAEAADRDAVLWTISHLLRELPRIERDGESLPVPLDLLARHGLTRTGLRSPGARRTALIRDYLEALAGAMPRDRGANLHQRIRSRLDAALIAGAREADEPLRHLLEHSQPGRWRSVWTAWREARALIDAEPRLSA